MTDPITLPALPEPDPYLFQHEETGLTQYVDAQQVEWGFETNKPRLHRIGGTFTEDQMQAHGQACANAVAIHYEKELASLRLQVHNLGLRLDMKNSELREYRQARKPLSEEQKRRLIGSYFAEDWAKEEAMGLLHDFERAHGIGITSGGSDHG